MKKTRKRPLLCRIHLTDVFKQHCVQLVTMNLPGKENAARSKVAQLRISGSEARKKAVILSLCDVTECRRGFALHSCKVWFYLIANHAEADFTGVQDEK